jgi:hypothetical protein
MIKQLLTVIISIVSVTLSHAQSSSADTAAFEKKALYAVDYYNINISEQAEIYNGPEYFFLPRATKGTPYLENRFEFTSSTIKYNGTWYSNVSILYDAYKDILVATQPQNQAKYILKDQYLTDFILFGHHFVHFNAIDTENEKLREGYYEQLYAGKSIVICKYEKSRTESTSTQGVEVTFDDKQTFYISKGGAIYSVSSKGSVLNVFKDKKKELSSYLKNNNISFKENKGLALSKLAAYYDQISN